MQVFWLYLLILTEISETNTRKIKEFGKIGIWFVVPNDGIL